MQAIALILALLVTIQSIAPSASAAETIDLPSLIAEAKANNPSLREARKRWEAAQARIPLSKGLPPPRIGVEFEDIPKGSIKLNQATIMYQLIQSLPFPGKLSARQRVAVAESQIAAAAFKQAEWDILSELKAAYYDLLLLDRELEIQREQSLWVSQAVTAAEARYASGEGMQDELVRLQAESLDANNEVAVLTHRRDAMAAHLNHLLNRPTHDPIGYPADLPLTPLSFTIDELWVMAQESQPELLVMKYSLERAEASYRLAKRELWPDLETMAELRDPAMGPIGPWDLTLALVIPFWFWTKLRYGVRAALYDKESMEAAYEAMRNQITRRIHEHWHEAQAAYTTTALSRDGLIPLARQSVTSLMAGYRSGTTSSIELVEALRNLAEQQRRYYQNLVALEQHLVMLEQSVGIPLRPEHEPPSEGGSS